MNKIKGYLLTGLLASIAFVGSISIINHNESPINAHAENTASQKLFIKEAEASIVDLSTLTAAYVAQNGDTLTGKPSGNYKISIANSATVTLKDVTINNGSDVGLTCQGSATIILEGTNNVQTSSDGKSGIFVPEGSTLTIKGDGTLTARATLSGAAIGGYNDVNCGKIVIESGTINAYGGYECPGIGNGSWEASCGDIEIKGGTVYSKGDQGAAGIGSASSGSVGNITISGGKVTAIAENYVYFDDWYGGAGIGSGVSNSPYIFASCGDILISGGIITARGAEKAPAIGAGSGDHFADDEEEYTFTSSCGNITITDGVSKMTLTKGKDSPDTIGGGMYSEYGTVTIGGKSGSVSTSPYIYYSEGPNGVIVRIDEIPNPVVGTDACKKAIEEARKAYDNLPNEEQKNLVTNYDVLLAAEEVFAVTVAKEKINALPAVENITLDSKDVIDAARAAYDALNETQKTEIDSTTLGKLLAAEAKYAELKEADDNAKANNVKDLIAAIGTVEYTTECKEKIDAARAAYNALTEDQKALVTNLDTLTKAEADYAALIDEHEASLVEALIENIGTVVYTPECKEKIDAARAAYNALTEAQKALVDNLSTLTTAESTYANLVDEYKASEVEALIENIGTVEYTPECKAKIDAARAAYNALTEAQKALVDNYSTLTQAEADYAKMKADHEAAAEVETLIENIGTVENTPESREKVQEAREAYDALTEDQKALVNNYEVLIEAEKTIAVYDTPVKPGLSGGAIAGIVIGSVFGVLLIAVLILFFLKKKKKQDDKKE